MKVKKEIISGQKRERQCEVCVVTTYKAVQHLLFIVETLIHKRVTLAVNANEPRVNMEIVQSIVD